jgi:hypothetical protein
MNVDVYCWSCEKSNFWITSRDLKYDKKNIVWTAPTKRDEPPTNQTKKQILQKTICQISIL